MRTLVAMSLAVGMSVGLARSAWADVALTPDKILRIEFATTPVSDLVPDTLMLQLGMVEVVSPYGWTEARLYNANTWLGTCTGNNLWGNHTGPLNLAPAATWKSSESRFLSGTPAIVDFDSIRDGSIQGCIDFSVHAGMIDVNLNDIRLFMIHATGPYGGTGVLPYVVIESVSVVPEPATLSLLALGGLLIARRRRA